MGVFNNNAGDIYIIKQPFSSLDKDSVDYEILSSLMNEKRVQYDSFVDNAIVALDGGHHQLMKNEVLVYIKELDELHVVNKSLLGSLLADYDLEFDI